MVRLIKYFYKQMFVILTIIIFAGSSLVLADNNSGKTNHRRNQRLPIDLTSEVTSRDQIGRVQNNVIILCPLDRTSSDMSSGISGEFTATASSRDETIATAATRTNARNHVILDVNAGANDTERDKITSIDISVVHRRFQTGIPPRGEGRGPHSIPLQADRTVNHVVQARVLARSKCDLIAQQEQQRNQQLRDGARTRAQTPSGRNFTVCVNSSRRFDINQEIRLMQDYQRRRTNIHGNPAGDIQGLWIKSNSNPNIAVADVYGRGGNNNLQLVFSGLTEGTTRIVTEERPLLTNVLPFSETWNVTVEPCNDSRRQTQTGRAALPEGYQLLPAVVPQRDREAMFDDIEDMLEDSAFESDEDSSQSSVPGSTKAYNEFMVKAESGLISLTAMINNTEVGIHCPTDAQAGDMVTCSVISDNTNYVDTKDLVVEIESTKVIQEDTEEKGKSWLAITLPAAINQANLVVKDKTTGKELCRGKLPMQPSGMTRSTPSEILFPRNAHIGKPIMFKGPFNQPVADSLVTVDGQSANVLAKSPNSLIVENPSLKEGVNEIVVQERDTRISGPIHITKFPASNDLANIPFNNQKTTGNRLESMGIDPICQAKVDDYRLQLKNMVDHGWKPAKPPSKGTWVATLEYNLTKDLSVQDVKVTQSSGYTPLDRSAVDRVHQLTRQFSPLPQCFSAPYLPVEHTFKVIYR